MDTVRVEKAVRAEPLPCNGLHWEGPQITEREYSVLPSVAVVGATGAVGEIMRQVLAERRFPLRSIKFLASERSAGKPLEFQGKVYPVEPLRAEAFAGIDIALSSTPASISRKYSLLAARA